jgi:hypothetical protein
MNEQCSSPQKCGSVEFSPQATEAGMKTFTLTDADAAVIGALRRLAKGAVRNQAQSPLVSEEYYGGDRKEESVPANRFLKGVVTRNHYGCLVLNATRALFIDVDMVQPCRQERERDAVDSWNKGWLQILEDLRVVLGSERGEGFRIYRTAAGFRILATSREFEPDSPQSHRLMNLVGADAAFVKLCRTQNSFRARLTPKPWRCGMRRPPNFFPRETAGEKQRFAEWLSRYERSCRGHATCQYLGHVGPKAVHKRIAPIIELHDHQTKAHTALPLA